MRVNQFVAAATGVSRRKADQLVAAGKISVNGRVVTIGQQILANDTVTLDGESIFLPTYILIMLNKPAGYVCSRNGQGAKTIYNLLPTKYQELKPIGRLDKNSSGLLLLTNDGQLAQRLTNPKFGKEKIYEVKLDKPLSASDRTQIEQGVKIDYYISRLQLSGGDKNWTVTMREGKNRQIRRTFDCLGYRVVDLHRSRFGDYSLGDLKSAHLLKLDINE